MSLTDASGTSSCDPEALRVYVRITRDMDQELLGFARGALRIAIADFRLRCPDAARALPDLDRRLEDLALGGLRLADLAERVAADFEAAGEGPDLIGLLRPEVADDLGALSGTPADLDGGTPAPQLASMPVARPILPVEIPEQSPEEIAGDFLGGLRAEVTGTMQGLVDAALHPADTIRGLLGMVEHPGDALRTMLDWDDLESGRPGRWAGHMLPGALLALPTDGVGFFVRALRVAHRFAREAAEFRETVDTVAREMGEQEARHLVHALGRGTTDEMLRAMMPSEIRRFVEAFGPARVRDLVERYTAQSLAYYGVDFFEKFQGVTDETMRHVMIGDGIRKGKIDGCHDRDAFLRMIHGTGEIILEATDASDPSISLVRYKLYKRLADGSIEQPPRLRGGDADEKTVIRGLDPQQWRALAAEATERAVRVRAVPKGGGPFRGFADDGREMQLYYRDSMIDSFFPVMR